MKIAIFSDPHLGYARFEEDSYRNMELVLSDASKKADLIICAGDIFDIKVPKLETIKRAIDLFNSLKLPVVVIFGNHERRAKGFINPVQLLASATDIVLLHGNSYVYEKNGEKLLIFGMGYVPDEYAQAALEKALEGFSPCDGTNLLVLHQTITDFVPVAEGLSLTYLKSLPFDLIINGHIHEKIESDKVLLPGSTLITQLKKSEEGKKGYFLYDTNTKSYSFNQIDSRPFFYETISVEDISSLDLKEKLLQIVENIRSKYPDSIISIKVYGSIKKGDSFPPVQIKDVFVDNHTENTSALSNIAKLRSKDTVPLKESAIKELKSKVQVDFDAEQFFELLLEGPDSALEFLLKDLD